MQINGLYRHGYLIAPAVMDAAQELLHETGSALAKRFEIAIQHHDLTSSIA